ncbi:hypothetical protein HWV62_9843 [Athelia sp. TMB]|nr:hypothetical protein HWV62_9843 [Athelia sp. TMB]
MPPQGGQQASSRKNPARSGKKAPSVPADPKPRAQKKGTTKKEPGPTGKARGPRKVQVKSAEFVVDSDGDGDKLPAESEERDDVAPSADMQPSIATPRTQPSSPLSTLPSSPPRANNLDRSSVAPAPAHQGASRSAPTPPAIACLNMAASRQQTPASPPRQRSPSPRPPQNASATHHHSSNTVHPASPPLGDSAPPDGDHPESRAPEVLTQRPASGGVSTSSPSRGTASQTEIPETPLPKLPSPRHRDNHQRAVNVRGPPHSRHPSPSSPSLGEAVTLPVVPKRRPRGTPMPRYRELSPLTLEDDCVRSSPPIHSSEDSMPEAPSPYTPDFEDLHSSGSNTRLRRSVLGPGNSPMVAAGAVVADVRKIVNIQSDTRGEGSSGMPQQAPPIPTRTPSPASPQHATLDVQTAPTEGAEVERLSRSQSNMPPPRTPERRESVRPAITLGRPDNHFMVSPFSGRVAYHFIRDVREPELRAKWQTPPQRVIEKGHRFLDHDESPGNHRRNFPHLYDADGNPLEPDVPWSDRTYDVGLVQRKTPSPILADEESITAEQWRHLKGIVRQDKRDFYKRYPLAPRHSPSKASLPPSRSPSPPLDAPPLPEDADNSNAAQRTFSPSARASSSSRPPRAAAQRAVSEMRVSYPQEGDMFQDSVEPFGFPGDVSSGSGDEFEEAAGRTHESESESDGELEEQFSDGAQSLEGAKGKKRSHTTRPRKKDKGKGKADNAEAGPSNPLRGRPSVADNMRVNALSQKIKGEIMELAAAMGINYGTMVRKLGFNQQEQRSGEHLANIFKMVEKHERSEKGQPRWQSDQYNTAYQQWKTENAGDPDASHKLLQRYHAILSSEVKPLKRKDIEKRVSEVGNQMASLSNNYLMGYNIAVVGAVIHLGPELASTTFAANMEQNLAMLGGFKIDQQEWLLKAKSILMLQQDRQRQEVAQEGEVKPTVAKSFWDVGQYPRDDYKRFVRHFLGDRMRELIDPPPARWDEKLWPSRALANKLILVGWGPNIATIPNEHYQDKRAGSVRKEEWEALTSRIPQSWKDNKLRKPVPDDELDLDIIRLDDFFKQFPKHMGKAPCVADHKGHVLWFADDGKSALKGRAPLKGSRRSRAASKQPVLRVSSSSGSESDPAASEASSVKRPPPQYRATGTISPSGHTRKRARVESDDSDGPTPRPTKPLPAVKPRSTTQGKRKRDTIPSPELEHAANQPPLPQRMPTVPPMPQEAIGGGLRTGPPFGRPSAPPEHAGPLDPARLQPYPSPYMQPGYAPLPSYAPPPMYPHQQYGGAFYPPHFPAQQQWPSGPQQHGPPWGPQPADFPPDDYQRMMQNRMMPDRRAQ